MSNTSACASFAIHCTAMGFGCETHFSHAAVAACNFEMDNTIFAASSLTVFLGASHMYVTGVEAGPSWNT